MRPLNNLVLKLLVLLAIVGVLQVVVFERFHRTEPLKKFEQCLETQPSVIYFCDSCNAWVDAEDSDRRAISELLADRLVGKSVGRIDGGAYHLELYEAFVDLLIARGEHPDLLIMPINLRSFSTEWNARPSYAFDAARQQIRQADNRFALALKPLLKTLQWDKDTTQSLAAFKRTPVFDGEQWVGTVDDFENEQFDDPSDERVRKKFIYHYMYTLEPEHRKLVALRNIANKATAAKLKVLFYVTPIDCETGNRCLGDRFAKHIQQNVNVLRSQLAGTTAAFIDCSAALDANAFSWIQYPNEHLNELGRTFVADTLVTTLVDRFAFAASMEDQAVTR